MRQSHRKAHNSANHRAQLLMTVISSQLIASQLIIINMLSHNIDYPIGAPMKYLNRRASAIVSPRTPVPYLVHELAFQVIRHPFRYS